MKDKIEHLSSIITQGRDFKYNGPDILGELRFECYSAQCSSTLKRILPVDMARKVPVERHNIKDFSPFLYESFNYFGFELYTPKHHDNELIIFHSSEDFLVLILEKEVVRLHSKYKVGDMIRYEGGVGIIQGIIVADNHFVYKLTNGQYVREFLVWGLARDSYLLEV